LESRDHTAGALASAPAGPAAPALIVDGLRKRFGEAVALEDAGLRAARGEIHALLGENGAGKSTLIRILAGVVTPDGGSVTLDGSELSLGEPARARAAGISTAFQELSLLPDLDVAENLLFGREPLGPVGRISTRALRREARALLESLDVHDIDPRAPLRSLDLSQRQVLEIVKAISREPSVLILDEPTSALSAAATDWALSRARDVADAGAVVLFISHRLSEVRSIADRITILRAGCTVAEGSPGSLDDDAIVAAMLGRRIEHLYPKRAGTPGATLLEARDLRVGRRVGPLDLDVRAGEILGVAGLQGQGQRELLMALGGALPWSGEIALDGRPYRAHSPRNAIAAGVVLVPEDRQAEGLFLAQPVRPNLTISSLGRVRSLLGALDLRHERRVAHTQAQQVSLPASRLEAPVATLSGGNQQKVVLGKALFTRPRVLLLYDCTRGVDVGTKAEIFQLMSDRAADGVGIVFYSSDISELVNMSDRVAVLADGRLRGILERGELGEQALLALAVGSTPGAAPDASAGRA
jgi:ABC-type sugar transport system ATPase subunit